MSTKFMFSYGMNTDVHQMANRAPTSTPIGRGVVRDHAFRFALHADVYPQIGTDTYGVLWEMDDAGLCAIDQLEGYPYYYLRKIVDVEANGTTYQAIMYYMTPNHPERQPDKGYYDMLVRGYSTFNVPMEQIETALARSIASPESQIDIKEYKRNRAAIAFQSVDFGGKKNRRTRWFNSYTDLVKFAHGRKVLRTIELDAAHCGISVEQMASDYVCYDELTVPDHFQVRDSDEIYF